MARVAVVGHVEWAEFVRVPALPSRGEIVHATEWFEEPGGGGAVAAVQMARLAGSVVFYTALGDDALGHRARDRLEALGVTVACTFRPRSQRRVFTHLGEDGERTITVIGSRMGPEIADPLPWDDLADCDGVFFTAGDVGALRSARRAGVLTATPRAMPTLSAAGVRLDVLVGSASDPGERYEPGDIDPPPAIVVRTEGERGGRFTAASGERGRYEPQPLEGPVVDTYGAGDSFAAALTFGLGAGRDLVDALQLAARCGAACVTGSGPYSSMAS